MNIVAYPDADRKPGHAILDQGISQLARADRSLWLPVARTSNTFYNKPVSTASFPSGPWTGFYNYGPGDRHRMDLDLQFANGDMRGTGNDDVGVFSIRGRYDETSGECHWTKSYRGSHDVFYRGFREGKGIWGTWEIQILDHGGFHIWPKKQGTGESAEETDARSLPAGEAVEAVSTSEV